MPLSISPKGKKMCSFFPQWSLYLALQKWTKLYIPFKKTLRILNQSHDTNNDYVDYIV